MFTREQIDEIKARLLASSKTDRDLEAVERLEDTDIIAILRHKARTANPPIDITNYSDIDINDYYNYRISVKDLKSDIAEYVTDQLSDTFDEINRRLDGHDEDIDNLQEQIDKIVISEQNGTKPVKLVPKNNIYTVEEGVSVIYGSDTEIIINGVTYFKKDGWYTTAKINDEIIFGFTEDALNLLKIDNTDEIYVRMLVL